MKNKCHLMFVLAALLAATARADDLADKGRQIFTNSQHAVVTIEAVVKTTYSSGAHASEPAETKTDVSGTVLDPSGLAVLALSSVDPADLYHQLSDKYKIETEVTDIKLLLDDGTELPAEIILRDKDLDLAYIRPKTKPSAPMASIDFSKSSPADLLESLVVLSRLNRAAGRGYAASVERVSAVVRRPRTYYVTDASGGAISLGCPAFALNGKIVGLFVTRAVNAGDSSSRSMREYMTSIIIPAEDIMKGAKQAMEVKPSTPQPAGTNSARQ
ncbi:MAG: serine protease [Limisphaerales bacterium]